MFLVSVFSTIKNKKKIGTFVGLPLHSEEACEISQNMQKSIVSIFTVLLLYFPRSLMLKLFPSLSHFERLKQHPELK